MTGSAKNINSQGKNNAPEVTGRRNERAAALTRERQLCDPFVPVFLRIQAHCNRIWRVAWFQLTSTKPRWSGTASSQGFPLCNKQKEQRRRGCQDNQRIVATAKLAARARNCVDSPDTTDYSVTGQSDDNGQSKVTMVQQCREPLARCAIKP